MERFTPCPLCAGRGAFAAPQTQPCPRCRGRGVITREFAPHTQPTIGHLPWEQPCPACRGTGQLPSSGVAICAMCHGTGRVPLDAIALQRH